MKLFGFAASTREHSLNRHLFDQLADRLASQGCRLQVLDYSVVENLPLYTAQREIDPGIPAAVQQIAQDIREADGLVIASPEYNFSIPGPLKNGIDWISRIKPWALIGKPVLLMSVSASPVGGWRGLQALRVPLGCLGATVIPWDITLGGVAKTAQIKDRLKDAAVSERVDAALAMMLDAACPESA